uniref:GRIP1 associated protein 1 n=1 Tax=Electrophorus electricus TaxID=8005 RepID=A0A4W4DP54_ELEEL
EAEQLSQTELEMHWLAQLLELRTQNYQLSDDLRKNTAELNSVRQKTLTLEKDCIKAQKALSKSKKAQEVDALLSENEMLQGKLHCQEDDFRLQNSTLMQELSKLCSQIEQLERENQGLKEGRGLQASTPNPVSTPTDGEFLRMQAENAALQKKLAALQEHYDGELNRLRGIDVNDSKEAVIDKQADTNGIHQLHADTSGLGENPAGAAAHDPLDSHVLTSSRSLPEVELKLQTEMEEKVLLREQLQAQEVNTYTQATLLRRDGMSSDYGFDITGSMCVFHSRTKIEELQQRKEEELKSINLRVQKLQTDLMTANQNVAELKDQLQSKQREHELALHALKEQIQSVKIQELNLLREQNMALNVELQQKRTEQESFLAQRDDLISQLQESNRANTRLLEQVSELGLEKDKLQQELEEAKKSADKRKAMLDELAIEMAQEKSRHKEELGDLRLQHEKEVLSVRARYEKELRGLHEEKGRTEEELHAQLRDEKARTKELESLQHSVEELQAQVQSMEGAKGWFERRLKEAEVVRACAFTAYARIISTASTPLCVSNALQSAPPTPQLKDLKRQLHLERKRADKLQERLQEILTNAKTKTGLEELVLSEISSPNRTQQTGDSSSVSSFSYREMMKEGASAQTTNKSNTSSPQSQRPADLSDDEVSELFQRLAEVQQEKWLLEEKVKHLEVSCSSMADDICKKSAIIETYVMDSRRDGGGSASHQGERGGLSSVLRDLVKPGDENLREMNKKLQNMLEEQLTKNMHLQKVWRTCTCIKRRCGRDVDSLAIAKETIKTTLTK